MANAESGTSASYVPHKIRSHPFKCITLPLHFILLFMFFWFGIYPLIFVNVRAKYTKHYKKQWSENWSYYFWIAAFLLYLFLLCTLIWFWRKTPNYEYVENPTEGTTAIKRRESRVHKGSTECCSISLNKTRVNEAENSHPNEYKVCFVDMKETPKVVEQTFLAHNNNQDGLNRKRPAKLHLENENMTTVAVLEHVSSPLTPRDQFFFDLLTAANQSLIDTTVNFIVNERKNCENERLSYSTKSYTEVSEYFMANIPKQDYCKSEAFIYVEKV